jgi:hypothetical protein
LISLAASAQATPLSLTLLCRRQLSDWTACKPLVTSRLFTTAICVTNWQYAHFMVSFRSTIGRNEKEKTNGR